MWKLRDIKKKNYATIVTLHLELDLTDYISQFLSS